MNFVDYLEMEYVKDKDGEIITKIPIKDYCMNINGIVHGGVTMTLIDTACGKKASEYFEGEFVTSDGYVNFLRASKNTKFLYAKCKTKKVGRKLINIDCDVFDDNKKLIAIGRFTFMKI
ncbi:PaaI family thioesterase [Anaerococcus hydrogenalis]|uniref:PaaI family thioesterase n=1 Tax=Anaerococcus hydrogenalis TaxID=33029 RepID=UPI0029005486|nr:PaaI family thioesterase [Anaerococcus hydrogenalis]MDU1316540.1 PaaI family thioesterase [Anaerococcus hydrogenalis]